MSTHKTASIVFLLLTLIISLLLAGLTSRPALPKQQEPPKQQEKPKQQEQPTVKKKPVAVTPSFSPLSSAPQGGAPYTSAYVPTMVQSSENTREFDHLIAPILD